MSLVKIPGAGLWVPMLPKGVSPRDQNLVSTDTGLLDADEEELQFIGRVHIDGYGSKTFGTSGSGIGWLAGASITFASGSTLRVGVKKASQIDTANGPAARATIGAAAFDVYDDLTGGTDTISSTTWRNDAMSAGTGYTVTHGDLIAVCFHLDVASGTPSVKVRGAINLDGSVADFPTTTLVTSGPTYTTVGVHANLTLTFDDGTLGWLDQTFAISTFSTATGNIGNTNIFGNIINFPFPCSIDALAANVNKSTNAANLALDLYSTPLGTPSLVESVTSDANINGAVGTMRFIVVPLTQKRDLAANTDYAIGVRQTTATGVTTNYIDVDNTAYWKVMGLGSGVYAANSTAGATFSSQNSGKRRYAVYARISHLDDGSGPGGGSRYYPYSQGGHALAHFGG